MIIHAATLSLVVHPAAELLPVRHPDSPEARALRAAIAEVGIIDPLQISKGRIVDGRERWLHAKALGKETVPCIEIPEADVQAVVLIGMLTRKHYTKSALAYLAFPFWEAALKESKARRLANLKKGALLPDSPLAGLSGKSTVEEFSEYMGVDRKRFFEARNVHGHFSKHADMKEHFEPLLLSGEMSLGAVLQGIAGWLSTKGKDKAEREQLLLWQEKIKGFCDPRKFAGWEKADAETKAYVLDQLAKGMRDAWPADLREAVLEKVMLAGK